MSPLVERWFGAVRVVPGLGSLGCALALAAVAGAAPDGSDPAGCREGEKAAVVFFVLQDCPVSNALVPAMNRIIADFRPEGVRFTYAYIDPGLTAAAAAGHAGDYALAAEHIIDREHSLVKRSRAEVVPEAAVFLPGGKLAYHGRINNQFTGFGEKRQVVTERDLRAALGAALAGREVPEPKGKPVGCYIGDYLPAEERESARPPPAGR